MTFHQAWLRWVVGVFIVGVFNTPVLAKDYKGGELGTQQSFLYGKFESSMYFSKVSGTVQAFWLWNDGVKPDVIWNEVDVEVLGKNNAQVWGTNVIWEWCADCKTQMDPLNIFESSSLAAGWHTFTIEWTPHSLRWYLDGVLRREMIGGNALKINAPSRVMYNFWASTSVEWAGSFDTSALPTAIFADYVRVYPYDPSTGGFGATPVFEDQFNTLDLNKWRVSSSTFDANRVDFIPENVGVIGGKLALSITTATAVGIPQAAPKTIVPAAIDSTLAYSIQNHSSRLFLEIAAGGTANGDNLVQNSATGASHQNWVFEQTPSGLYKIRNEASDKYMSLEGGMANGTKLGQWSFQGANQEFSLSVEEGTQRYIIRPKNSSGPVLDVPDGLPVTGAQLQIWEDFGLNAQRFLLTPVGAAKPRSIPLVQRIEAEDFSQMSGVQTEMCLDQGGGRNVGWMDAGDWMKYTLELAAPGEKTIALRVANLNSSSAQLRLSAAGQSRLVAIPITGHWQNWTTVNTTLSLPAGNQTLTLEVMSGGFNINHFDISHNNASSSAMPNSSVSSSFSSGTSSSASVASRSAISSASVSSSLSSLSAVSSASSASSPSSSSNTSSIASSLRAIKIEAESYVQMNGVQTENAADMGGGLNVGWIDASDWMAWTITVPVSGSYTVKMRVASPNTGGQFRLDKDAGRTLLTTVNVPNTGGWQNWTTISATVTLPAGTFNLGLFAFVGGFNVNWLELAKN